MSQIIDMNEARTHLSRLLERVQAGEDFTITKAGRPIAKLTAFRERRQGRLPGDDKVIIHSNFDDPIPEWDRLHAPRRSDARSASVMALSRYDVETIW